MPLRVEMRAPRAGALLVALLALSPCAAPAEEAAEDGLGKQVFMTSKPACSVCHVLAKAGAAGTIGPSLDKLKPSEDRVRKAVRDGVGVMPKYRDTLTKEEIDAVSEYVATVAGTAE